MTTTSSRVGHDRGSDSGSSPHNLAHGSGVTLRLEGDAIVQGGPRRMLNPDVLARSGWHKADAITMLRRLADAVPTLPRAAHSHQAPRKFHCSSHQTSEPQWKIQCLQSRLRPAGAMAVSRRLWHRVRARLGTIVRLLTA